MGDWELRVDVARDDGQPLFARIARAVADDIRRGRLKPGDALPGSRPLANALHVHRNTVLAAYADLEAQGWIVTREARGTFVSDTLPVTRAQRFAAPVTSESGTVLQTRTVDRVAVRTPPARGTLTLLGGLPDVRLMPITDLARAHRRALRLHGRTLLGYGDPQGHLALRTAVATMLGAVRGVVVTPENVLITRGSQMALALCSRLLLQPGDRVAVESMGYAPAWSALRDAGATLVPLPLDAQGLSVDALEEAVKSPSGIRAVYLTPHHQYPTTVVLSAARRLRLLQLCQHHRVAVLEDDYDHEFHYEGHPVMPLLSADARGVVLYVGTLSKILAPGLRLGFVVAPRPLIEKLTWLRALTDRQGDLCMESAVAELMEDGVVQRHVNRMRRVYQSRRDALTQALHSQLGDRLQFQVPMGGMALWAHAPGVDVDAWLQRAQARGVTFQTARQFSFEGRSRPWVRLGYAALTETELREAAHRLRQAWP